MNARLPKKPETGRICAVCGKRTAPNGQKLTEGFSRDTLERLGIKNPTTLKAHPYCVGTIGKST